MDEDEELLRQRNAIRRQVVEAVLWAAQNGKEMVDLASRAPSRLDAVRQLTESRHGWSEFQAQHMLDVTFGRLSEGAVAEMIEELERLDRGEDTAGGRS